MGIMADSMAEYAQPLLDYTDGTTEGAQKAMTLAMICWNMAIMSEKVNAEMMASIQESVGLDDDQFEEIRVSLIQPMIQRHHEMFPNMSQLGSKSRAKKSQPPESRSSESSQVKKYPKPGRNALCPCNSGKKYKKCCGR